MTAYAETGVIEQQEFSLNSKAFVLKTPTIKTLQAGVRTGREAVEISILTAGAEATADIRGGDVKLAVGGGVNFAQIKGTGNISMSPLMGPLALLPGMTYSLSASLGPSAKVEAKNFPFTLMPDDLKSERSLSLEAGWWGISGTLSPQRAVKEIKHIRQILHALFGRIDLPDERPSQMIPSKRAIERQRHLHEYIGLPERLKQSLERDIRSRGW